MWNDIQENVYKAPKILPSLDKSGSKLPENSSLHDDSDSNQPNNLPLNDKSNIIKPKPIPDMVFSVIGDSISYYPRPWPKAVFQNALIEAAKGGGGMLDGLIHVQKDRINADMNSSNALFLF